MIIPYSDFKEKYLLPFVKEVNDKKASKIPYDTWKTLFSYRGAAYAVVFISFDEDVVTICIESTGPVKLYRSDSGELPSLADFIYQSINTEENNNMKTNNMINFDFGPCKYNDNIHLSMYGIAVKNAAGTFVSYDAANASIMDVDILNFDGSKLLYKMPVAIKDIAVGDVVMHACKPMFVTEVIAAANSLKVVDPASGEKKEIILTRSPFGFNFATKLVNLIGNLGSATAATADNPFGNLWMLMLMNNDNDLPFDTTNTMDQLLPLMLMTGGADITSNPILLYALMGNSKDNSLLPFLLMSNANGGINFGAKAN